MEEDFRQYFSGVLYGLKTTAGAGDTHVLIEHQSPPDKHMAFRLMRYAIVAIQRHLEAGHKRLPLVIPVLFCPANAARILTLPDGLMNLMTLNWLAERVDRLVPICWPDIFLHHRWYHGCTIVQAGETSDAETFVRKLTQRVPQHEDALMTIAQHSLNRTISTTI